MLRSNLNSHLNLVHVLVNQPRRLSETPSSTSGFCCANLRNSPEQMCCCNHTCLAVTSSAICGLGSGGATMYGCKILFSKSAAILLGFGIGGVAALISSSVCSQLGEYFSQNAASQRQECLLTPLNAPPPTYDEVMCNLSDDELPPSYDATCSLTEDWLPSYAELFPQTQGRQEGL